MVDVDEHDQRLALKIVAEWNESLRGAAYHYPFVKSVQIEPETTFCFPRTQLDVKLELESGKARYFRVVSFDLLRDFLDANPAREFFFSGLPLLLVNSLNPDSIAKAIDVYLTQEEAHAELGRNVDTWRANWAVPADSPD
jgi:hypothetical protein